jgi:hypothetical protein
MAAEWQARRNMASKNNNPTSNLNFLNTEIVFWNYANPSPDLTAASSVALDVGGIGGTFSYNAVGGYDYVVFHFGNGQAGGSPGGWWQAWYLNGLGATFTVPIVGGNPAGVFLPLATIVHTRVSLTEALR